MKILEEEGVVGGAGEVNEDEIQWNHHFCRVKRGEEEKNQAQKRGPGWAGRVSEMVGQVLLLLMG